MQPKTIETLTSDVDQIKKDIESLKAVVDQQEKERKKAEIESRISTVKGELDQKMDVLKDSSDAAEQKEYEKAETLSKSLTQLSSLVMSILGNAPVQASEGTSPAVTEKEEKKQGPFEKARDNVKILRNDGWGSRIKMGLAVGAVGYGVVKIFQMFKKREGKEKEEYEKKGFWGKTRSNVKKYALGPVVGFIGGKWLYDKLLSDGDPTIDADPTDGAGEQAKDTETLKKTDKEKFEKYQGLGANIDVIYDEAMQKELESGWGGMSISDGYKKYVKPELNEDDFKATVPMCIDNEFSSVERLLSEGGYYGYLREQALEERMALLKGWGKDKLNRFFLPYLKSLTSYIPFVGDNMSDGIQKWMESGNKTDRVNEIQLFFRQYAKVIAYVQDRRSRLKEEIAKRKFEQLGKTDYDNLEDAMNDDTWMEKYVYSDDTYKNFMGGKLHQAITVMKEKNLFDAQMSEEMKKIVKACDGERDAILNERDGKDVLGRLQEGITAGSLTKEHWEEGAKVCKNTIEDLKDNFDEGITYVISSATHQVFNTEDNNIQEFLKYSGLNALKTETELQLTKYQRKFDSGSITPQEAQECKDLLNSYFVMKKEILLAANALQDMKSENRSVGETILQTLGAVGKDFCTHVKKSAQAFGREDVIGGWAWMTLPLVAGGYTLSAIGKMKGSKGLDQAGRIMRQVNIFTAGWVVGKNATRRFSKATAMPNRLLKRTRYNIPHGDELFFQDILEGKVSGKRVEKLLKKSPTAWETASGGKINTLENFVNKLRPGKPDDVKKALRTLCIDNAEMNFLDNKSLRNLFLETNSTMGQKVKKIVNGYALKDYTLKSGVVDLINGDEFKKFLSSSDEHKKLMKGLLAQGEFKSLDEFKAVVNNIKNIDLTGLDDVKIGQLVNELVKEISVFGDTAKLNGLVDGVKRGTSVAGRGASGATDILTEAMEEVVKNHTLTRTLDAELQALKRDKGILTDNNLIKKVTKEMNYIEEMKGQLKTLKNVDELDALHMLWTQVKQFKKQPGEMLEFLNDVKHLLERRELRNISKIDWDNLDAIAGLRRGANDEILERVIKVMDDIKVKNLTKLADNGFEAMTSGLKFLGKLLARAT